MRYCYDGEADALYVRFREDRPQRQVRLTDGTIVDLGPGDAIIGVEVLVPSSTWDPALGGRFVLEPSESVLLHALAAAFRRGPAFQAAHGGSRLPSQAFALAA